MIVSLNTSALKSLEQIRAFLEGSEPVNFAITDHRQAYAGIAETLKRPPPSLSRPDKGVLRLYAVKVSGLSRQQTTRLRTDGRLEDRRGKSLNTYGWAVRTGDVAASVPETGIIWLLLAGGLGW